MYDADIVVLGGGPAGLAAAIATARRGMKVLLAEAARPPIDKACGEGLMPDSQAAAARLGVHIPVAEGHVFRGIRFSDGGAAVAAPFPVGTGLGVRRTVLHERLVTYAERAGVDLQWGTTFSGIDGEQVRLGDRVVRARWIIGADGSQSRVRRWSGLDTVRSETQRFGFRRHFRVAPWSEFMEIHWGQGCQLYLTPVSADEVCLVLMSRDPHLRLEAALAGFPELRQRLPIETAAGAERGAPAGLRLHRRVTQGNVALVGDASGRVDAITGEGLCLAFQQAEALASAIAQGRLQEYETAHRQLMRRPTMMGEAMLLLDRLPRIRRRAIPAMAARPELFRDLLALHVGEVHLGRAAATAAALCWGVVSH